MYDASALCYTHHLCLLSSAIFGQSLEETMRYEHIRDSSKKVPTIVEMCVDFIRANGLDVEGLFR